MKITIENTSKIVFFNGLPARIWCGETSTGIKVHCYITCIAVDKDETQIKQFEKELEKQKVPSAEIAKIPLRMII